MGIGMGAIIFKKNMVMGMGNTFLRLYWYGYGQYLSEVLLTTLVVSKVRVNPNTNPNPVLLNTPHVGGIGGVFSNIVWSTLITDLSVIGNPLIQLSNYHYNGEH
jgi:hypothetical protein